MKKLLLSTALLISLSSLSFCQYQAEWGKYMNDAVPNADFSNFDESQQLVVDIKNVSTHDEYVYVTGRTHARSDHEGACAPSEFYYGSEDAFIAKYDKCGNLQWFHFIGTDNDNVKDECGDFGVCLTLDKDPITDSTYIYVAGYSYTNFTPPNCSSCLPCLVGNSRTAASCSGDTCVFQKNKKSGIDAFIAKYNENGELIKWTYLGGDGDDYIIGISVFSHDLFITGTTSSSPGFIPASTAKFDTTLAGIGQSDAFVAQMDKNLCTLKFFSYMGGPEYERSHAIRCFKTNGNPADIEFYISGATSGDLGDTSYHPLNSFKGGLNDAFLSLWKLNKGTGVFKPQWLEYVGGKSDDRDREMIIDKAHNAIITGFTSSNNFINTYQWSYPKSNFYDTTFNGIKDAFVAKFNPAGNPLWGTYFGGAQSDEARGIARYSINSGTPVSYIAISGGTKSADMPLQPLHPPFEAALNGGSNPSNRDAFVAILTDPVNSSQVQQLEFSSFFGGNKNEWDNALIDYGPDLDLGGHNELYVTFYSKSNDIENWITTPGYHHNTNAGADNDGFLAKILNSNITGQFDCNSYDWGTDNPGKINESTLQNNQLILYPNPAINTLTIDLAAESNITYKLISMLGEQLMSGTWSNDHQYHSIDISPLPSGVYIITCDVNEGSFFQKFAVGR